MTSSPRILFCGGQSVGHLAPLVAVWREVKEMSPQADALFCCTQTPSDASFLAREDLPYVVLNVPRSRWLLPLWLPMGCWRAMMMLRRFRPTAIFSKGGSVSLPVVMAARVLRLPIVLHESDAVSGRATRFLAPLATILCRGLPFDREKESAVWKRAVYTGNPVRRSLRDGSREHGWEITGLSGRRPVLLVMGGSQGAVALNEAVLSQLDMLLQHVDVVHLTGRGKESNVVKEGYYSLPFATDELPHLYAMSDLALSRAGAGAMSELAIFGIPMIIVPLEGVAQNHQVKNAQALERVGACVVIPQNTLASQLVPSVVALLQDPSARQALAEHLQQTAGGNAAAHIAEMLVHSTAR